MEPFEIKHEIVSFERQIISNEAQINILNSHIATLQGANRDYAYRISQLQSKCVHQLPNKPNNVMGKGVCGICGHSDY